jgi:sulfur carrier protein
VNALEVTVKLFATLRNGRFKTETRCYAPGTTVREIAEDLRIPLEELSLTLLNGQAALPDQVLTEGDTLSLFPPVGGG